ncbi:MAG: hypothetical protein ABFS46_01310, partial [Myxococcota bacterium]
GFGPPRVVSEGSYRRPGVTMNANALPRCVALLALVALTGCGPEPAEEAARPCPVPAPRTSPVTISAAQNGGSQIVAVDKQFIVVCQRQAVEWLSGTDIASWEVSFQAGASPFDVDTVRSAVGSAQANNIGVFKYGIVAVTTAGDTLPPLDPDVVVIEGL